MIPLLGTLWSLLRPDGRSAKLLCLLGLLAILSMAALPGRADAHASLIQSVPEANSQVAQSPQAVTLTFNERLEKELYYIRVLDEDGRPVTEEPAQISPDQTQLSLALPQLADGLYTVTYHVISADGHPVQGTYVMVVGEAPVQGDLIARYGNELHLEHHLSAQLNPLDIAKHVSRILYYISLLTVTGWVLWGLYLPFQSPVQQDRHRFWSRMFLQIYILALIAYIGLHVRELLGEQPVSRLPGLFTGTGIGQYWLISLVLAVCGLYLLHKRRWFDAVWAGVLLGAKGFSGHAVGFEPQVLTVFLNIVHLLAAAVWIGGLWVLMLFWNKHRDLTDRFIPTFSRAALSSIIVLTVTGSLSTLLFLPNLRYLLYSEWGYLLLAKVGLVVLVVAAAAGLRFALKKWQSQVRDFIKIDFTLMIMIVAVVGVLTFLSPVPPNEPLNWHEMGDEVHTTVNISPKTAGADNTFEAKVWLPQESGAPKGVWLKLQYMDNPDIAPIEVPLEDDPDDSDPGFEGSSGYSKFAYKSVGPFLPFKGKWQIEIRVRDQNDDEIVNKQTMIIY